MDTTSLTGQSVRRRARGQTPLLPIESPGAALVLAGGGALDDELLRTVGEALRPTSVVVGRASIDGVHGPRFAVASGLIHLYAAQTGGGG